MISRPRHPDQVDTEITIIVPMTTFGKYFNSGRRPEGHEVEGGGQDDRSGRGAMSYSLAMPRNNTMGAPPGSITNGSREPIFHGPQDCRIVPKPERTNVALSRFIVSAEDRLSVWLTRNTAEMGAAAITNTCWMASGIIRFSGRISSTGWGAGPVRGNVTPSSTPCGR